VNDISVLILTKFEVSWQTFLKVPIGKLRGIPCSEIYADTFGQTGRQTWMDGHGEANRHPQSPHKICIGNVQHLT